MKKLYLNIIWPGIIIGLLLPSLSGKLFSPQTLLDEASESVRGVSAAEVTAEASATALLTESSEVVCGELLFEPDNPQAILQLPAFDPSKGSLTAVQVTSEGTLIADISRENLRHNDYHALFSADLKGMLPGEVPFNQTARLSYQASMRSDQQMKTGIKALIDETSTESTQLTEALDAFYGTSSLDIPFEVANLIDVKTANFNYRTQLNTKVCIEYIYEGN